MARIGEYRLKAYELLYSTPLCEYAENVSGKNIYNVLIIGNGWMGNEMFKAIFWEGQSVNSELNITVASQNAKEYEKEVYDGEWLPALKLYTEKKKYAKLRFLNIKIEDGLDEAGLKPLDFFQNYYNYIVISLGNSEDNWLAATEIITQISKAREKGLEYTGQVIVNVFNEFADNIPKEDLDLLIHYGHEKNINVNFFGNKEAEMSKELGRIARNINFAYAMKYDQRCNKKQVDAIFEKSLADEFINSPCEYEVGDLKVVSNFIGGNYSADSSFAAAVHIPMKLAVCREMFPDRNSVDILKEAIQKKNSLYRKLVALEHRRWNAYTIMRGFRAPTVKEESSLLYHNGNTHQDKKRRLHICLCDCSEEAVLENDFDRVYKDWINKKCPANYPSELDRASLRIHQLTGQLAKNINLENVLSKVKGECPAYIDLRYSIRKLANDEDHALVLYQRALEKAREYAEKTSDSELKLIDDTDLSILPMKIYNARTNFFALDQQLIEMLPFALWFGEKYKVVITITDGSVSSTCDVIIPTLFCAAKAVYIGRTVGSKRYQDSVESYFDRRGRNTISQFIVLSKMDIDSLCICLEEQIKLYGIENVIINCVPNRGFDSGLAIGRLMEKYNAKLNVVQYLPGKGITSFSKDKNIGVGINNKNYSLTEFIQLMGGHVTNEYTAIYDTTQYDTLVKLFKKYCNPIKYKDQTNAKKTFYPWTQMTKQFSEIAKDYIFEEYSTLDNGGISCTYQGSFSKYIFLQSRIGTTLRQLQEYRIIDNYSEKSDSETVFVQFDYIDSELVDLLQKFELNYADEDSQYKTLKFIPLNGGLKISDRKVQRAAIYNVDDSKYMVDSKVSFMNNLAKLGYIENLRFEDDGKMSFVFKDMETMQLFKNQGVIFELIVYHFMRESGMFDDCETGVKILWNVDEAQPEEVLLRELQEAGEMLGYKAYKLKRSEIKERFKRRTQSVMNEVDVIGIKGMSGVMVSCKTAANDTIQWLYEINTIAQRFQSCGVMAISADYSDVNKSSFLERAKQMGVSVWGTETLWNPERMRKALQDLVNSLKK